MITQTQVMWTCLPNGVVAGSSPLTVKLSLVVTPQLFSNNAADTISGTVFQSWPAYVRAVAASNGWGISFNRNSSTAAVGTMVDNISASPSFNVDGAQLWQAIFPASTPVVTAPATSATPQFRIHSYDAGAIAQAIRAAHQYVVHSHVRHGKLVLTGSDPYSVLLSEHKRAKVVHPKMLAALRGVSHGSTHEALKSAYQSETGGLGLGYELMRHAVFFDPAKQRSDKNPDLTPHTAPATPVLPNDFNTLVAHLGGQPQLQRKLGLIIDLTLPVPPALNLVPGSIPPAYAQVVLASIVAPLNLSSYFPGVNLGSVSYVQPGTIADMTLALFRTRVGVNPPTVSSGGSINNGFLPLGDPAQYVLYTEDTEGTPFKLDTVAGTTTGTATTDLTPVMPALRTTGLAISQTGRETVLAGATTGLLARQAALVASWLGTSVDPNSNPVAAEDVVRGYAVDVAVGPPGSNLQFHSLCLRDSRVYFPGLAAVTGYSSTTPLSIVLSDEGYTKATSATSQSTPNADGTPGNAADLNLHTALFGWEGWSLAAQRPGRAITAAVPAGDVVQTETPLQPVNTNATTFPSCQITVRARAGKLTRLRFGQYYTLRARVLDLAGNDMSVPSAAVPQITTGLPGGANPTQSPTVQYLRYEPVPNPVLLLQNPLTEGEHLENLVIRSNPWGFLPTTGPNAMDAVAYAASSTALHPMNPYAATCARWVAPPKGAWGQAEALGAFDAYFNSMSQALEVDIAAGRVVAGTPYTATTAANAAAFLQTKNALFLCSQKEQGVFTDTHVWNTADTSATVPSAVNPVQIFTPPTAQNLPAPTDPGQPLGPGQYNLLLSNGSPVYLPYLPDANAQGIMLQQLATAQDAGQPAGALNAAGAPSGALQAATVISSATRTYLPRPGCNWPEIDLPQIVLQEAPVGNPLPSVAYGSTNPTGLDPSAPPVSTPGSPPPGFTPPASHANITFSLAPGQQMSLYYGSTVANPGMMAGSAQGAGSIPPYAPYRTLTLVHAVQQPMPPNGGQTLAPAFVARNPGDTSVTFTGSFTVDGQTANAVDMTTAWADYVDVEISSGVAQLTDGTARRYVVKSGRLATWTLNPSDTSCSFPAAGPPPPLVQQYGDTKTRQIFFQLTATSRFREYFPASLQASAANFQSAVPPVPITAADLLDTDTGVRIPSTSRPAAPKVLYVVPTYGWSSTVKLGHTVNARTGRGLRVFVDRPWFLTGDTEMLGVVVSPSGVSTSPYVSQWGQDPTRFPQADKMVPLDQTQVIGGTVYTSVPLYENPSSTVSVVAFPPSAFDPVRNLWYFDIEFAPSPIEAPFVRLALTRFQPNSVGGPGFTNNSTTTPGDLRMSSVALADMVKLTADRTAAYTLTANDSVSVIITGPVQASEEWTAASGTLAANTINNAASYGRVVYGQIQEATVANPGEFDWNPLGGLITFAPFQLAGAAASSTALSYMPVNPATQQVISIPKPPGALAGAKHQLLITEYEVFLTDANTAFPVPSQLPASAPAVPPVPNYPPNIPLNMPPAPPTPLGTTSRVVFSDILPLPY